MIDPDPITTRMALIGLITVSWAKLEGSIDVCNHLAFENGGDQFAKQLPQSMKRKLSFMRQCHNHLSELHDVKVLADVVIDSVHKLKERRNNLIHGVSIGFSIGEFLHQFKLTHGGNGLSAEIISHDNDDLRNLFLDILRVFNLAEDHVVAVSSAFVGQKAEEKHGNM